MKFWYQQSIWQWLLWPLHWLMRVLVSLRRLCYRWGLCQSSHLSTPIIVIGNISVGGTGKSPLVIQLAQSLRDKGYKVGIISRGYGGNSEHYPLLVGDNASAETAGDEALMIYQRTMLPLVVDPQRARAAEYLVERCNPDVIISDDGLQHSALGRDLELVVIDSERLLGNGLLLPAGPLREPKSRLKTVDAVIFNHRFNPPTSVAMDFGDKPCFNACFHAAYFVRLNSNSERKTPDEMKDYLSGCKRAITAIAGIGNPQGFFSFLDTMGFGYRPRVFADHHYYQSEDLSPTDGIFIMTEKDAVKCQTLGLVEAWYLVIEVNVDPELTAFCINSLALEV